MLTVKQLKVLAPGERAGDGSGLFARRSRSGDAYQFVLRLQVGGKRVERGCGAWDGTLAGIEAARDRAREMRAAAFAEQKLPTKQVEIVAAAKEERARADAVAKVPFRQVAEELINGREPGWKWGSKSSDQWRSSLEAHVFPIIGDRAPATITVNDALAVLTPIWSRLPETARRLRSRCQAILDAVQVRGLVPEAQRNPFA